MSGMTKKELETKLAAATEQLAKLAELALQANNGAQRSTTVVLPTTETMVGLRNISSQTVGFFSEKFGEVTLNAAHPGQYDPQSAASVPHAWWMQLRTSAPMRKGMLVRDDSVLGEGVPRAPEDLEREIPVSHAINAIEDPFAWIESKNELELADAIAKVDSEPSLRRLIAAVTYKIWQIGEEHYREDEQRGKKSLRALPAIYKKVEELAEERLDELSPIYNDRAREKEEKIRF